MKRTKLRTQKPIEVTLLVKRYCEHGKTQPHECPAGEMWVDDDGWRHNPRGHCGGGEVRRFALGGTIDEWMEITRFITRDELEEEE